MNYLLLTIEHIIVITIKYNLYAHDRLFIYYTTVCPLNQNMYPLQTDLSINRIT